MSVAVAAAMMVSLGACGNSADAAKDGTQSAGASGKVYNIGICQQLEHPALDQATQGFEDVLKEKLGDNVKFDLQNAQNEQANASTIANNFVSANVDLILCKCNHCFTGMCSSDNRYSDSGNFRYRLCNGFGDQ